MKTLSLCGKWRMTGNGFDCEGTIPGSLYSFLLDAGLMEDPYYRDNEFKAFELTHHDYVFEKRFDFEEEWQNAGKPLRTKAFFTALKGHLNANSGIDKQVEPCKKGAN